MNLIKSLSWSKVLALLIFGAGFYLSYVSLKANITNPMATFEISVWASTILIGNKTAFQYLETKKNKDCDNAKTI